MCKALANNIQLCHDVEKHHATKNQLQKPIKKFQPLRFFHKSYKNLQCDLLYQIFYQYACKRIPQNAVFSSFYN